MFIIVRLLLFFGNVLPLTTVANFVGIYQKREKIATCYDEKMYTFPFDTLNRLLLQVVVIVLSI